MMIGKKSNRFWMFWKILWKFVCPIAILLVIIATAVFGSNELRVNNIPYPSWAHGIGYIVSAIPILIIIFCAIYQSFVYKFNWVFLIQIRIFLINNNYFFTLKKMLLNPDDSYYDNCRRFLASEGTMIESLKHGINLSENKVAPINNKKVEGYDNSEYNEDY
jgi:hypothetical protein